jgi:hypothetical protein
MSMAENGAWIRKGEFFSSISLLLYFTAQKEQDFEVVEPEIYINRTKAILQQGAFSLTP